MYSIRVTKRGELCCEAIRIPTYELFVGILNHWWDIFPWCEYDTHLSCDGKELCYIRSVT